MICDGDKMRRTKEDAEQTRRDILGAAMDIFSEKGYSKTTFDEIAKHINLTKGAVYWHFRNKPDIVAALINHFAELYVSRIREFLERHQQMEFQTIIDMQLFNNKMLREDPLFYKFIFFVTSQMEWSEAILNKVAPSIAETKKITRNLILDILQKLQQNKKIKEDVDASLICEILMTMYGGMLDGYFTKSLQYSFDELVQTGFNLIYNNIKAEGV